MSELTTGRRLPKSRAVTIHFTEITLFEKQLGIDLGTVNVLVYVTGKGILLQEPSVVAISERDSKIVAVGHEARDMLGRTPESIEVARPLRAGVVADYVVTEAMLRYFIRKAVGRNPLLRPRVMISTPRGVTSVESRAVKDAAEQAGAKEAYLIPEPLAAAYGAGLPIGTPTGNMVVDIGGGTTEAAVVSMYDIVVWSSVRVGGNRIDDSIINYVRKKYNLLIGEQTAEEIKIKIGSALPLEEDLTLEVRGRDQVAGLPRTIEISSEEVTEAIAEPLSAIVTAVKQTLEKTPPELAADIIDRGMVITGGGSQLRYIDDLMTRETGVPCYVAENPMACVAIGAGKALENYAVMRRSLPET
ncbi:MAG: rod shape-determining protein [Caldilineae bacterium]|nr:rod shape-determining protein [Anaerolineae bacterium]MCB9155136.1 rod shape-determining protein [Caldilineae bacterium]